MVFAYFGFANAIGIIFFCNAIVKNQWVFANCSLYDYEPYHGLAISAVTNLLFFVYFGFANAIEVLVNEHYKKFKCFLSLS